MNLRARSFLYSPEETASAGDVSAEGAESDAAANDALLDSIAANEDETPAKESATAEKPEAEAAEEGEAPAAETEEVEQDAEEAPAEPETDNTKAELDRWKAYAQQLYMEREKAAEKQSQKPPALDSYLQRYHASEKPEQLELRKLQYRELSNVLLEMAGIDPQAIKKQLDLVPHLYNDVAQARIESERSSTLNMLKESGVEPARIAKFDNWMSQQLAAGKRMGYVEACERFFGVEGLQQSKAKISDSAKGRAIKLEAQARMAKNATKRPNPAKSKVDYSKLSDKEWLDLLEKDTQID